MPTGAAAGEYSLLIGGVVVPLLVSQTVNGKVTFVEKFGTGEPNGTGKSFPTILFNYITY